MTSVRSKQAPPLLPTLITEIEWVKSRECVYIV